MSSSRASLGVAPSRYAMLLREYRRHHQRANLAVRRPVRHDLQSPAQHRQHHLQVVGVCRNSSCGSPAGRQGRRFRGRSRLRCAAAPDSPARSCFPRQAPTLGRIVEILRRVHVQARMPQVFVVPTGNESRSARRDCGGRRGRSKSRHTPRTARRTPGRTPSFPTRRAAAPLPASKPEVGLHLRIILGSAGSGPAGWRRAAGPIERPTSPIETPTPGPRRTEAPGCGPSCACRPLANRRHTQHRSSSSSRRGPMPDSSSKCGEPTAPALKITSLLRGRR